MEKGLRNTLIVSGLLGGVSVGGYFLYRSILKAIDFEIKPQGVRVISRDAQNIKLGVTLGVLNPSDLQVTLTKQQYDLYFNDVRITKLTSNQSQVVYPNSTSSLFLEIEINYQDLLNKLSVVSGQGLEGKLKFIANFKDQRMKLVSKLSIKYGILPSIPIDVDSGSYTLKEWGFVG